VSELTTHRVESWRVDLLTSKDSVLKALDGVTGGRVDQDVNSVIRGGGTLELDDMGQGIDWLSNRIQVWWQVGAQSWPLGVFLLASPVSSYYDGGRHWSVEMLDKLVVLDQDKVDGSYSVAAGSVVTSVVKALIESAGENAGSLTGSTLTAPAGMVWEAGTSKLRIINDLLASINYFSLHCDGHGRFLAEPYVRPQDRATSWDFSAGAQAVHSAEFTRDEDLAAVPNKVVLVSVASGSAPALISTTTNTNPSSPFSYTRRGRWVVYTETNVEASSQAVLDALASRKLADLSSSSASISLSCAALPLELNNAVGFHTGGVSSRGVVQSTSLNLEVGAQMEIRVREVAL